MCYTMFAHRLALTLVNACVLLLLACRSECNLLVTTDMLDEGRLGREYGSNLSATANGSRIVGTWSLREGRLPPGIGLDSQGRIRGVPTATGLFNFTVRVAYACDPFTGVTESSIKSLSIRIRS